MKMNYKTFPRWACWIGLLVVSGFAASSVDAGFPEGSGTSDSGNQRERLSLNNDWLFSFGSPEDLGYSRYLNKGGNLGIQGIDFKGKKQSIRLPHDWAAGLAPSQEAWDVSAFTPLGFHFPETSIGWYKRAFFLPGTDAGRTLWLEFDGIFRNAQIW